MSPINDQSSDITLDKHWHLQPGLALFIEDVLKEKLLEIPYPTFDHVTWTPIFLIATATTHPNQNVMAVEARETHIVLTNDNYAQWLIPMEAKLHKLKSLHVVMEKISAPDPEKDKDNAKLYVKLNEDAYAEIVQYLSLEVLAYVSATLPITDKFNGVAIWKLLNCTTLVATLLLRPRSR
ncbi:hypothetical protein PSTT_13415 [Puccinia striiformis]|uniref:Uncharacterized protein n=1 Tax=Puccinia striiformis TaxID=27350 RepID=A0A2S4USB1_9BASI|nr:hypothetical protein PSTT_13415 [Puccinia striiformis]